MAITVGGSTITLNSGSVVQDPPGSAPSYLCRAWVNFDGVANPPSIRGSGNVTSITDNGGSGDYTANFTTAMSDANYTPMTVGYATTSETTIYKGAEIYNAPTTAGVRVQFLNGRPVAVYNPAVVCISAFR